MCKDSVSIPGVTRERPLLLAPMDSITDRPFRRLARRYGADMVTTEFVSVEGLIHDAPKSFSKLTLADDEHPVAIQVFGSRIESVVAGARLAEGAGPDCVDLNFGCPARKVAGKGGGAGLLRTPEKLEEMTREVVRALTLPVTAKVRLGWDLESINVLDVCRRLERAGARAVTVHARTRSQTYGAVPDWSWIQRVKEAVSIPVIGNGNVQTPEDAERMFEETGCDAVMVGRAATGNPWIFREIRHYLDTGQRCAPPSPEERIEVLLGYVREAVREKGEWRGVIEARKLHRGFLRGLPGAAKLRASLMVPTTVDEVVARLAAYRKERRIDG